MGKDVVIREFRSSFFNILPKELSSEFTNMERIKLRLRIALSGNVTLYYINKNDLENIAFCFLKRNYLNKYSFLKKDDYLVNPYFVNEKYRNKGYGKMIIEYVVNNSKIKNIYALVKSDNLSSIKCLQFAGFKQIGFLRKNLYSWKLEKNISNVILYRYLRR